MGHFADECHPEKKKKGKDEKANLVEESEEESALMILFDSEFSEGLLQGNGDDVNCDLWYLDTGVSSHMTSIKSFFHSINKDEKGNVNFGDGSSIKYEGRGTIIVICKNGEEIELKGVLYLPKLKKNILSLEKLDDQGCKTSLSGGYLTIRDKTGKLLTKTKKTRGNMYQIKLSISESCNLSREDEAWLWHGRFCHQSFHTLDSMIKGEFVRSLPVFKKPKELFSTCISISYEDFNLNIFQPTDEVIEEPTKLPQSNSIQDGKLVDEEPLRYRPIQDVYEETNLIYDNLNLLITEEPCTYAEAVKEEVWSAMVEELSAIERNKTWTLVKAPPGIKPIGVKWVFRMKKDQTGAVVKYKARLAAKGYSQKFGIDYEEIYTPVARFDSIRILIAIAAQLNWNLHHLDVKSAFLNGVIKEDLYVMQPEGYVKKGKESYVLKLTKALYGLKQAPRVWNSKLNKTIDDLGFKRSRLDTALYYKGSEKRESACWNICG